MGGKTAIALGLVTGLVAGGAIVAAVVALTPPLPAPIPVVSTPPPSAAPTASASPAPTASASPAVPSASAAAPSAEPAPSASPQSEAFGIGQPAAARAAQADWSALAPPIHVWVDENGIVRDGAIGGLGPDIVAQGRGSTPDVEVTP